MITYDTLDHVVELILESYKLQTGVTGPFTNVQADIIDPRPGTLIGLEITKDLDLGEGGVMTDRLLRVYVKDYGPIVLEPFRLEEVEGLTDVNDTAHGVPVVVAYGIIPRFLTPQPDEGDGFETDGSITTEYSGLSGLSFSSVITTSFFGNSIPVTLETNRPLDLDATIHLDTVDDTAMAAVDYTGWSDIQISFEAEDTLSGTQQLNFTIDDDTVDARKHLFRWTPDGNYVNTTVFNTLFHLTENNSRITSHTADDSVEFPNDPGFPSPAQYIWLASQDLPKDQEYYYEATVSAQGAVLQLFMMAEYYSRTSIANGYNTTSNTGAGIGLAYGYDENQDSETFTLFHGQNDHNGHHSFIGQSLDIPSLPYVVGFITHPTKGFKISLNGMWIDPTDTNNRSENSYNIPFVAYEYEYNNLLERDLSKIAPIRVGLQVGTGKYASAADDIDLTEVDIKFASTEHEYTYSPLGSDAQPCRKYTGEIYQPASRQFTITASSSDEVSITTPIKEVHLENRSAFSYNKLITQHDYTGFTLQPNANFLIEDNYNTNFVPMVGWTDSGLGCGITYDLTQYHLDVVTENYNPPYPDAPDSDAIAALGRRREFISQIGIDYPNMPQDVQGGDCMVFEYKNLWSCFNEVPNIFEVNSSAASADGSPHVNVPCQFLNGTYIDNQDGTYTYRALLRWYVTSTSKKVLVPVPIANTDAKVALPPLYAYLLNQPGTYSDYSTNDPSGPNSVCIWVPYLPQNAEDPKGMDTTPDSLILGVRDTSMRLYYTLDGSTPTTSSPFIQTGDDSQNRVVQYPMGVCFILDDLIGGNTTNTVKAFVTKTGYANSAIITGVYKFTNNGPVGGGFMVKKKDNAFADLTDIDDVAYYLYYREDLTTYRTVSFSIDDSFADRPGTFKYQFVNCDSNGTFNGTLTPLLPLSNDNKMQMPVDLKPLASMELIRRFYDPANLQGIGLHVVYSEVGALDTFPNVISIPPVMLLDFYRFNFILNGGETDKFSLGSDGYICITDASFDGADPTNVYAQPINRRSLADNDFRYSEIQFNRLNGNIVIEISVGAFTLTNDGQLTNTDTSDTVSTGLTFHQGDTIAIRMNLRDGDFTLIKNHAASHDQFAGKTPDTLQDEDITQAVRFKSAQGDAAGTEVIFATRESQFKYGPPDFEYPQLATALDNLHD